MTTKIAVVTSVSCRLGKDITRATKGIFLLVAAIIFAATSFGQTIWTTDKNHAQLHFSVVHFGIAHIEGIFKEFTVTMTSEKEDFSDAGVEMVAQVTSINTQMEIRDNDLRRKNWFDAEQFPVITFKSTSFKKVKRKELPACRTYHFTWSDKTCCVQCCIQRVGCYNDQKENSRIHGKWEIEEK